jgi:thioredoxin reductase/pSer/pThr/pTyr-binding forkhead associated (FHA) protein/ferredoxin
VTGTGETLPDGMVVLNKPGTLPDVLDFLVVGGGPAGTAAAFHAKELGLSALVIDYDDLMKRIRDYPKDKLILPDFGGGDQMKFPKGGALVSLLHFAALDKDEMCAGWKKFYRESSVPAQVGIELLGLQRAPDGVWRVKTWNHNTKSEYVYAAKHVAIAIGRGVPRRFDIPGNTDGIGYRLADANAYVDAPVLVMGGGTSAAEAVIAISNAKAKAKNESAVYWSYRGDKLPKVSKALADVFFEAYMGNGNIRYYPNSEPVAVVAADDKKEYLSVRTDRRLIAGRPNETSHLEFQKEYCIACIGEDIPEGFLNSMGISMATGGPMNKKRMVVTQFLETQQPNVYLIGDILSQAYLETDDFAADPATFKEIKHRGNIKAALCDGVLVAKVAAQRVAGKKEIDVVLEFEDVPTAEMPKVEVSPLATIIASAPAIAKQEKAAEPLAFLVRMLAGSVQEDEFPLSASGVTTIGQKFCDIVFPDDQLLSERHASVSHSPDGFLLRDDGSATGVFLKATEGRPLEVQAGDIVRLGRQFLLFGVEGDRPVFIHYDQQGKQVSKHELPEKTIVLGREAPDVTLDPKDMTLSRRHMSIAVKAGKVLMKDLKSVNGTFLKVKSTVRLEDGDEFRVGRQAFKLSLQREKAPAKIHLTTRVSVPPAAKVIPKAEKSPAAVPADAGANLVRFKNLGKSCSFEKGETICDIAEKNGIKITAECHAGICGSDAIRVLEGRENMNPLTGDEKGTLEDICGLQPGEYRLACVVKPSGPMEIEIPGT